MLIEAVKIWNEADVYWLSCIPVPHISWNTCVEKKMFDLKDPQTYFNDNDEYV